MEIIYTCPKCGHDLQEIVLTSYPPQYEKICNHCGYTYTEQSSVVRIPFVEPTTAVDPSTFNPNNYSYYK